MVLVADMEHLIACLGILRVANAYGPVSRLMEVGEFLRVQVEQVAWGVLLVTVGRLLLHKI